MTPPVAIDYAELIAEKVGKGEIGAPARRQPDWPLPARP
jgi:hypothetical protein